MTTKGPVQVPGVLVLLRHGQSTTNAAGQFTGWADVPLTAHGRWQAGNAGRRLAAARLDPDEVHTSLLSRAITTAELLLAETGRAWLPVRRSWRLNERHYGALTGRCKAEVRAQAGERLYWAWRNSLQVAPPPMPDVELRALRADARYAGLPSELIPASESLGDVVTRVGPYWTDVLAPRLTAGRTVLVVAHGNSLRALISILDRLSPVQLGDLRVRAGGPLCYRFTTGLRPTPAGGTAVPDIATAENDNAAVAWAPIPGASPTSAPTGPDRSQDRAQQCQGPRQEPAAANRDDGRTGDR